MLLEGGVIGCCDRIGWCVVFEEIFDDGECLTLGERRWWWEGIVREGVLLERVCVVRGRV